MISLHSNWQLEPHQLTRGRSPALQLATAKRLLLACRPHLEHAVNRMIRSRKRAACFASGANLHSFCVIQAAVRSKLAITEPCRWILLSRLASIATVAAEQLAMLLFAAVIHLSLA